MTHFPRRTGDVRADIEVSSRTLPWLRMPRRLSVGIRHQAEVVTRLTPSIP